MITTYTFEYTGDVQTFTVPASGIYKLEVWGAKGSYAHPINDNGGLGGYAKGYQYLEKGTILYIVCGEYPGDGRIGGYNGGGDGGTSAEWYNNGRHAGGGGGGATHIALVTGTLYEIGKASFDSNGFIVAGGGGGANGNHERWWEGGTGGGTSGGSSTGGYKTVAGGTQTDGYAFGKGQKGRNGTTNTAGGVEGNGGGGGGYYGGYAYTSQGTQTSAGGGGGSGWIGGVTSWNGDDASMENGVNAGHGHATITFVASE